jgi:hypothetical protein
MPSKIVLSFFQTFETIQNYLSTAIIKQYRAYLSTASCDREELNKWLID